MTSKLHPQAALNCRFLEMTIAPNGQVALLQRLDAAQDVAAVVALLGSTPLLVGPVSREIEKALREFAADCLDAVDSSGHYQEASAIARRLACGDVGPEALLPARLAASPGGPTAMGMSSSYHLPSAVVKFAAVGVLSDTASEAAIHTARNVALYSGFMWLHSLPDNPMAGQNSWSGETMWAPWCAFVKCHHAEEQSLIKRAARELAANLVTHLKSQLPAELWAIAACSAGVRHVLRPINTTNVVPFRTGDIAADSINRYYLEHNQWIFAVGPEDDHRQD
jgi:hypothetical protein